MIRTGAASPRASSRQAGKRGLEVSAEVGFGGDQNDLSDVVAELLADSPGVIVVLGDADDGSRLLAAIDEAEATRPPSA